MCLYLSLNERAVGGERRKLSAVRGEKVMRVKFHNYMLEMNGLW